MTDQITDDELDRLLAQAAPQVADFPPSPRRREQIMRQRAGARRPYALIGLATAGLAAAAILLVGGPSSPVRVEPAGAAAVVLNRAADAAQRTPGLPPDRLRYTREIENHGDGPFVVETWTRADGSTARRVVTAHGRSHEQPDTPGGVLPWIGLSSREIVALATDPAKLLSSVRAAMSRPQPVTRVGSDGRPGKPSMAKVPYTDHDVFDALMALHDVALPLGSAQRAALLRAAALLDGVTDLGRVADPLGRPADAITIAGDHDHEGYGRAYLLSATTGQIIATLEIRDNTVAGWFVRQQATAGSTSQRPLPPLTQLPPARYRFTATR